MEVKDALTLHEVELTSKKSQREFEQWLENNPQEARQVLLKLVKNQVALAVSNPKLIPFCKFLMECTIPNYYNLKQEKQSKTAQFSFKGTYPSREKPVGDN